MPRRPLTWLEWWYVWHLNATRKLYLQIADTAARRKGRVHTAAWESFEKSILQMLHLVDIHAAGMLRYQATALGLVVPANARTQTDMDIPRLVAANPWLQDHLAITQPIIIDKARLITLVEQDFISRRHDALRRDMLKMNQSYHVDTSKPAGGDIRTTAAIRRAPNRQDDIPVPIYRLEMHRRNSIAEITNLSEQLMLADPVVGAAFPMASYHTRDDRAVRPTHMAMAGFIARRDHPVWAAVTPPAGFNCRCFAQYHTLAQAVRRGWMTKDGQFKVEIRWPNTASQTNYETGKFPDRGWGGGLTQNHRHSMLL